MAQHTNTGRTQSEGVIEAEKGKNLSPGNLHIRLRVVEVVMLISLLLNLLHWSISGSEHKKIEQRLDSIQSVGGVR